MANTMYGKAKQRFANGAINWTSDTFRVYLIDTDDYTPNFSTDEYLGDIASAAKVAYTTLENTTNTLGVCDADDCVFSSVTGDECEALVIAKWTGNQATSPLILYLDSVTGLPITPTGTDIAVTWDNGANKIFAL